MRRGSAFLARTRLLPATGTATTTEQQEQESQPQMPQTTHTHTHTHTHTAFIPQQGWREGPITFQPTYKYHLGCQVYSGEPLPPGASPIRPVESSTSVTESDTDSAPPSARGDGRGDKGDGVEKQKKRTPAWCDRVLWLKVRLCEVCEVPQRCC